MTKMERIAATELAEAEEAVSSANQLVRDQLVSLRAEQDRLQSILRAREADLHHLQTLMDDLTYQASTLESSGPAPRWITQLERLRAKEQELRAAVQVVNGGLRHLTSLITAVSSVSNLRYSESGTGSDPLEVAITGRTLQGQEAERYRLAREVHDGPAQVLANAIMGLEYCERLLEKRPASVPGELQRLKSGMSDGLEEVRRFIFDLRPSSLEHQGLCATLESYTTSYQNRFGILVQVNCEDVDHLLTPEQRFVAFRVTQESMQNCRKHAAASKMEISIQRMQDRVVVSVRDNGRGFDVDQAKVREGHYGLQGMRERAELVAGSVVIFSELGYGTEVRLQIPLNRDAAHIAPDVY